MPLSLPRSAQSGPLSPRHAARLPPRVSPRSRSLAADLADRPRRHRAAVRIRADRPLSAVGALCRLRRADARLRLVLSRRHRRHRPHCHSRVPGRRHLSRAGASAAPSAKSSGSPPRGRSSSCARHRDRLLRQVRRLFSRVWLAAFYGVGLVVLVAIRVARCRHHGAPLDPRRPPRPARRRRRRRRGRRAARQRARRRRATPTSASRRVRRPRRRPLAAPRVGGFAKLGTVDDLVEFARRTRVDLVHLLAADLGRGAHPADAASKLWVLPVDIRLSAHINKLRFRPRAYSYIGDVPVLDVFDRPIADWDVVMKWLFDQVVGSAGADRRCRR